MLVWVVELDEGPVAGSPRFSDSTEDTSHTASHSHSMLAMSFSYAWKGKVVKVVETLTDQLVEGSVGDWRLD